MDPNRFSGCLLGLAVGDALGTTLEFQHPGCFTPITDMVGGGPFGLEPGRWTDDTTGAIYGQLSGAYYGEDHIPNRWLSLLHDRSGITDVALKLYREKCMSRVPLEFIRYMLPCFHPATQSIMQIT